MPPRKRAKKAADNEAPPEAMDSEDVGHETGAHDGVAAASVGVGTGRSAAVTAPGQSTRQRSQSLLAEPLAPSPESTRKQRREARRTGGSGTTPGEAEAAQMEMALPGATGGTGAGARGRGGEGHRGNIPGGSNAAIHHFDAGQADSNPLMEAVVKVFCTHTEPNFSLPWQRKRQFASSSTGFIISGRRILTNAHCIDYHTQVKVKRRGDDAKFVAKVLAVGTECDIAMLTVEDDAFWRDVEPVHFGMLPQLQDAVTVIGYPIGGDTVSVTSGVVSRIEVTSYVHGSSELLGIQIDAAINSGNSGGPAFNDADQCVGIAFQSLKHEDAENIGYIIPTPVIQHFINDYERNGRYTGFPWLGVEWQKMENPDLRSVMKMQAHHKGVLIRAIEPTTAAHKVLAAGDVLLSFDGTPIANDGTVPFRSGERISFSYLVSQKYTHEEAELKVLKKGEEVTVNVSLQAPIRLVPFHTSGLPPSYFIVAGLVFTVVTVPFLRSEYGKEYDFESPVKLLDKLMHGHAERAGQQVVLLAQVLAADVNIGYEDIINTQVLSLNGVKLGSLSELVRAVECTTEPFLVFELDYSQKVVLATSKARAATKEIMAVHCVAADRSLDLQQLAAAEAAASAAQATTTLDGSKLENGGPHSSSDVNGGSAPVSCTL